MRFNQPREAHDHHHVHIWQLFLGSYSLKKRWNRTSLRISEGIFVYFAKSHDPLEKQILFEYKLTVKQTESDSSQKSSLWMLDQSQIKPLELKSKLKFCLFIAKGVNYSMMLFMKILNLIPI